MFASFAALVRYWGVAAFSVAGVVSVLSLLLFPFYAILGAIGRVVRMGLRENALQALGQGILAGPAAMYLFTLSIRHLGVARAAIFPAIVPAPTLLVGWVLLRESPTTLQAMGLALCWRVFIWRSDSARSLRGCVGNSFRPFAERPPLADCVEKVLFRYG